MLSIYFSSLLLLLVVVVVVKGVEGQQVTLYDCGYVKKCHKYPADCTSSENCDVIVTWQPNGTNSMDTVYFEVSTKKSSNNVWIANSLNEQDGSMAGSSGELCIFNGTTGFLRGFNADATGISPTYYDNLTNVALHSLDMVDGTLICRYSRSIAASEEYMKSLDQSFFIVNTYGSNLENGVDIAQHEAGAYRYSAEKIQISAFSPTEAPSCNDATNPEYCILNANSEAYTCHSIATYTPESYITTYMVSATPVVSTVTINSISQVISNDTDPGPQPVITTTISPLVLECTTQPSQISNSIYTNIPPIVVASVISTTPTVAAPTDSTPTVAVPTDSTPTVAVPTDSTPTVAAPTDLTPTVAAPPNSMPIVAVSVVVAPTNVTTSQIVNVPYQSNILETNVTIDPQSSRNDISPATNVYPLNTQNLQPSLSYESIGDNMNPTVYIQPTQQLVQSPSTRRQNVNNVLPSSHFKNIGTVGYNQTFDLKNGTSFNKTSTNGENCIFDTCKGHGASLRSEYLLLLVSVLLVTGVFYR